MASYYKRKNGTYCVRVSNGMKNGKQELISATYKPPIGITASAEAREVKQFADLFEAAVHNGMYISGMKSDSTKTNAFGMTVGEFIQNHYFKRIEAKLSPNTVLCALLLGLRRGEIVALKWSDIDFEKGSLSVNKSAYKNKGEPQKLKPPKSQTSVRTVFFPTVFAEALNEWKAEQEIERKKAGERWKEQDFIFTNSAGDMISLYAPTKICSDFENRNHLHHLKLHGLRHTCGSLLVGNGVDPETVKSILGHDSLETTNLYIHPYAKNMKNAAALLGKIIANGESGATV